MSRAAITAIFARELVEAEADGETSAFIEWLERLRDEVLECLPADPKHTARPPHPSTQIGRK